MPKKALLLFFTMLFLLSACQTTPSTKTVSTISVVQQTEVVTETPATETATSFTPEAQAPSYPIPYPSNSANNAAQAQAAYPGPYPEYPTIVGDQPVNSAAPYIFKTSTPNTATLHGILLVIDPMLSRPEGDDPIFLVPLAGEGVMTIPPFNIGEVPQAEVDETTGEFTFTNIQPGRYAVVILTVGAAQTPARTYEGNNFAIVNVKDTDLGQTIELEHLVL